MLRFNDFATEMKIWQKPNQTIAVEEVDMEVQIPPSIPIESIVMPSTPVADKPILVADKKDDVIDVTNSNPVVVSKVKSLFQIKPKPTVDCFEKLKQVQRTEPTLPDSSNSSNSSTLHIENLEQDTSTPPAHPVEKPKQVERTEPTLSNVPDPLISFISPVPLVDSPPTPKLVVAPAPTIDMKQFEERLREFKEEVQEEVKEGYSVLATVTTMAHDIEFLQQQLQVQVQVGISQSNQYCDQQLALLRSEFTNSATPKKSSSLGLVLSFFALFVIGLHVLAVNPELLSCVLHAMG